MYIFVHEEERSSTSFSFIFPQRDSPRKLDLNSQKKKEKKNTIFVQGTEHVLFSLISVHYTHTHTHRKNLSHESIFSVILIQVKSMQATAASNNQVTMITPT